MKIINHLKTNFSNFQELNNQFVGTPPFPMIVLDNFLPNDFALKLAEECETIPDIHWTEFTRNGSFMRECKKLEHAPVAYEFVNTMHSALGMEWMTRLTNITDLIPDPYLTGAGYSRSFTGDSLKLHTDFNWNEQIKVHRMLSFIIYLNPEWKEEWGGHLQFTDFNKEHVIQNVAPVFNRAIIWRYHKRGFHGYPQPLTCPAGMSRNTFRLFYYYSDARHKEDDRPHRSLYWFDKDLNEPYDIPTRK
jgi:hypothetical protein